MKTALVARLALVGLVAATLGSPTFAQDAPDDSGDFTRPRERRERVREVAGEPTRRIVGDREQVGARRGPFKYLRRGAEEKLYDLAGAGGEHADVAARHPEELRELRLAVRHFLREHPVQVHDGDELDPEILERLRVLGYLGTPEEDDD